VSYFGDIKEDGGRMAKQKIMIVDDDTNISELISIYLNKECYDTLCVEDGESAVSSFAEYQPDLVLLDIMLPGMDGYNVCKEIRKTSQVPIIMVSAKGETFDKVLGLELGADDYIIKPFESKEVVARIKAVLRRTQSNSENRDSVESSKEIKLPDLLINMNNYTVSYKGEIIDMPPKEIELLYFLASHPDKVFTREQLLEKIWDYDYSGETRTVDVHVKRIREKLGENAAWEIATVWGIGYKFHIA